MVRITILIVLTISFLGILLGSNTNAFFTDSANSTTNVFGAATSFPTATPSATPTPPIAQVLVINEVLPDSSCLQGQTEAQWLEVFNGYPTEVNLKNFKITDGATTIDLVSAASVTVPSGGFVLLAHSTAIFGSGKCYLDNGTAVANLGGQLNIDTGLLQLKDGSDNIIDTVQWGGTTGLSPAQNQSVERVPVGIDSATGASFNASDFNVREVPTPGYGTTLILNEFIPNAATEQVEIFNPSSATVDLTGWTLQDEANVSKSLTPLGTIAFATYKVHNESAGWLNNTGPETLRLKDSSGRIVDSHSYSGSVGAGLSIGRITDAFTTWKQTCTTTTIGTSNNGSC
jgi:predicted ribosomally synthesized peptide with SipW-like signal peptide